MREPRHTSETSLTLEPYVGYKPAPIKAITALTSNHIATVTADNCLFVWETAPLQLSSRFDFSVALGLSAAPTAMVAYDEQSVIIGYADGTVILVNPFHASGERLGTFDHYIRAMQLTPSHTLVIATDDGVRLFNVTDHSDLGTLNVSIDHTNIRTMAFMPDGQMIFGNHVGQISVCDLVTGRSYRMDASERAAITAIQHHPDGFLVIANRRGNLHLFDPTTHRHLRTVNTGSTPVRQLIVLDGGSLATLGSTRIRVWDVSTGRCQKILSLPSFDEHLGVQKLRSMCLTHRGQLVAAGGISLHEWSLVAHSSHPDHRNTDRSELSEGTMRTNHLTETDLSELLERIWITRSDPQSLKRTIDFIMGLTNEDTSTSESRASDETTRSTDTRDDTPAAFRCPLSHVVMTDPVIAKDGYSYERSALDAHLRAAGRCPRSPVTGERLNATFVPNLILKKLIESYQTNGELEEEPDECLCPILKALFEDPVVTTDGFTYERYAITRWFADGGRTVRSPMTNALLKDLTLIPNTALQQLINVEILPTVSLTM